MTTLRNALGSSTDEQQLAMDIDAAVTAVQKLRARVETLRVR